MNPTIKTMAVVSLAAIVSGCSFNPIGESRFDCNRKENPSEFCRSFKALVKSTDGPLPESRFDKEFRMSDYDRATGIAPDAVPVLAAAGGNAAAGMGRLPHQRVNAGGDPLAGLPVRSAPLVQRVLIKRFVDDNDSLQDDVIVYREVKGARWTGFKSGRQEAHVPGAYPHRAGGSAPADTDTDAPPLQANLAQPGSGTDGAAGSAMSPAGLQSGDVNASKAER